MTKIKNKLPISDAPDTAGINPDTMRSAIAGNKRVEIPDGQLSAYRAVAQNSGILAASDMRVPDDFANAFQEEIASQEGVTFDVVVTGIEFRPARRSTSANPVGFFAIKFEADLTTTEYAKVLKAACLAPETDLKRGQTIEVICKMTTIGDEERPSFSVA